MSLDRSNRLDVPACNDDGSEVRVHRPLDAEVHASKCTGGPRYAEADEVVSVVWLRSP
jgi:hypothetical protein